MVSFGVQLATDLCFSKAPDSWLLVSERQTTNRTNNFARVIDSSHILACSRSNTRLFFVGDYSAGKAAAADLMGVEGCQSCSQV
jgi:hypothetical protein